jgi:hypothetical protein
MKQATAMSKLFSTAALAGALAVSLSATTASAAFVDYDHSAEGVSQSASLYSGTPMKSGAFLDYDHSAESITHGAVRANSTSRSGGMCGFIDCDHSAHGASF